MFGSVVKTVTRVSHNTTTAYVDTLVVNGLGRCAQQGEWRNGAQGRIYDPNMNRGGNYYDGENRYNSVNHAAFVAGGSDIIMVHRNNTSDWFSFTGRDCRKHIFHGDAEVTATVKTEGGLIAFNGTIRNFFYN